MSIFGKIWSKITGQDAPAASPTPAAPRAPSAPAAAPLPSSAVPTPSVPAAASAAPAAPVDVEAIMTDLETKSGHKSNWRYSIVDLMSLLGMENSLSERKALAQELGYTGDMNDSATMNVWLHKQVMRKMAENGGKVPASLMD